MSAAEEATTPSGKACVAFFNAWHNHKHELEAEQKHANHRERVSDAAIRLQDAQRLVLQEGERLAKG